MVGDPVLKQFERAHVPFGDYFFKHYRGKLVKIVAIGQKFIRRSRKSSEEEQKSSPSHVRALPSPHPIPLRWALTSPPPSTHLVCISSEE